MIFHFCVTIQYMTSASYDQNLQLLTYEVPEYKTKKLWRDLFHDGTNTSLSDIAAKQSWRTADPTILTKLSTTAILPSEFHELALPSKGYRGEYIMEKDVEPEYTEHLNGAWSEPRDPAIDNTVAIGLVYRDGERKRLVAACSGAICVQGFTITQIQDISRKTDEKSLYSASVAKANGLHAGIDWKVTIVRAMARMVRSAVPAAVPELAGLPIVIRSATNNYWVREGFIPTTLHPNFVRTYDETAKKLDALCDEKTGDFIIPSLRLAGSKR